MLETFLETPLFQLSFLLFFAFCIGTLGNILKQPLVVSFIVVGVLAGLSLTYSRFRESIAGKLDRSSN